jgi:hypothetical protein
MKTINPCVLDPNGVGFVYSPTEGGWGTTNDVAMVDYGTASELNMIGIPVLVPEQVLGLSAGSGE